MEEEYAKYPIGTILMYDLKGKQRELFEIIGYENKRPKAYDVKVIKGISGEYRDGEISAWNWIAVNANAYIPEEYIIDKILKKYE
jgi:hypothetical protein